MNLIPYQGRGFLSPFRTLNALRSEMDRFFDTPLFGEGEHPFFGSAYAPAIDVSEEADKIVIKADLPGMDRDGVDISITDNVLTLKGERKQEKEDKGRNWHRIERSYGTFARSVVLPGTVDHDKVTAEYKNGVLLITAPKTEAAKPKQIKVEVA
ncbi:MAG TPA: Hsp20/alpha crystallin family protein [bacterium]|nr:Hsp20/alpha crystallin family protein [bacterium]HQO34442.1 Hsp20/alpha crystallin family protein [bacterium]HQP98023.1 Hsp20/alpha crystallin family protein [bacterium]